MRNLANCDLLATALAARGIIMWGIRGNGGASPMTIFLRRRESRCLVWGSLAAVLYGGAVSSDQAIQAASPHSELAAALVEAEVALADLDATIALAKPMTNVALGRPDATLGSLNTSDE